ncbi:putative arylesterase/monoxygenase [Janibacter sp. HTCC2649]|uniref:alpha/beta hydrolase n=1 Tax=Janibacter sp. HTCC2649 TaxID=313589 RepID=UPI000066ED5E|nr:alpha/beta hydrolase [Janibacter sp. HTCC2649]EAP99014.1 putative arylesterase/monoxygenase [Janibacter sp. HTCC2649]
MAAPRLRTAAAYGLRGAGIVWGLHREAQIRRVPRELRSLNLRRPLPMWHASLAPVIRHLTDVPTPVVDGVEVREVMAGSVRVLVYEPVGRQRPSGAVVWMHGGGLMLGRAENAHERCSTLARDLGVLAVSVDYRVAPEAAFPAAIDDCMTVLRWVHEQAAELGVDPDRIAVGGDSAGGGLAACLAQRAFDAGLPVALQVLFYPMLDDRTGLGRDRRGIRGPLTWTPTSNRSGWSAYLGHAAGEDEQRAYAVAARRADLSGLAPAWIGVGEFDLFHDEDVEYARRLREGGVECELVTVPGMYHGADSVQPSPPSMVAFLGSASAALARAIGSPVSA